METRMGKLLEDKVAFVTGGSTGIGEAICKLFARHGASVVVNGLPGDPVKEVVQEIREAGGKAVEHVGDVGNAGDAQRGVQAAVTSFGKLDVLVANAGIFPEQEEVQDFPVERFEDLLQSNIRGVYHPVRAAIPQLRKTRGVILAAASEAALLGEDKAVSYGATKGWVIAFIRGVAAEQAKYGIRANSVAPGPIDTEMTRASHGNMGRKQSLMIPTMVPLGRRGTPEEVANVYLFLASDLASYVTGSVYAVDGGSTATGGIPGVGVKRDVRESPEGSVELEHQFEGRPKLAG